MGLLLSGITDIINFLSMSYIRRISSSEKSTEGVSSSKGMGGGHPKSHPRRGEMEATRREREAKEDLEAARRRTAAIWKAKKEAERRGERIYGTRDSTYFRYKSTPHRDDDSSCAFSAVTEATGCSRRSESSTLAIAKERRRREKAEEELRREKERRREAERHREPKAKSKGVFVPDDMRSCRTSSSSSMLGSYGLKPKGTPAAKSTALTPVSGRGHVPVGPTLVVPEHTPGIVYPTGPFGPGVVVGCPVPYPGVVAVDPFGGVVVGGPVVGVPECGGFISYGDGLSYGMY